MLPLSGRVDRASATETVDSGSISGQVKLDISLKTRHLQLFFLTFSNKMEQCKASTVRGRQVAAGNENRKLPRCLLVQVTSEI